MELINHFNAKVGYSLYLPEEWRKGEEAGYAVVYEGPEEAGFCPTLRISLRQIEQATDTADETLTLETAYPLPPGAIQLYGLAKPVSGYAGLLRVLRLPPGLMRWDLLVAVAPHYYQFSLVLSETMAERDGAFFNSLVEAIRIHNGPGWGNRPGQGAVAPVSSFFDPVLKLSLEVPSEWQAAHDRSESEDEPVLAFRAPADQGIPASFRFRVTSVAKTSLAALEAMLIHSRRQMAGELTEFSLFEEERFSLDGCPAYWRLFDWQLPVEGRWLAATSLQAYVLAGPTEVLSFDSLCLRQLQTTYLPLFSQSLLSTRFLGAKPWPWHTQSQPLSPATDQPRWSSLAAWGDWAGQPLFKLKDWTNRVAYESRY